MLLFPLASESAIGGVRVSWSNGRTAELRESAMQKYRVASVPIIYPKEAQAKKLSGKGLFEAQIDKRGRVSAVRVRQSTGSKSLDQAAIRAVRKFRYKPGAFISVTEPATFHHFGDIKIRF
ncbi:MAG: energy transducer TonB [Verrucomicrobiaceae bacterium]|nr:energy transducer TonB [Verrucomicrobiaceae bacterium]